MPCLEKLGLSNKEFDKIVEEEIKKKKKFTRDEVQYAKEGLASAVLRLMEAQQKARKQET